MKAYDVNNWYWQRQDGSLYSSAQGEVAADSAECQAFLAEGGLPTPYPKDAAGAESVAALFDVLSAEMENHMDQKVKAERGYDGVDSLAKYAIQTANATYRAEAEAAAAWVALCWGKWFELQGEAEASGETPSLPELLAELPELAWPGLPA
jgi:hypothetical protein